MLSAIFNGTDHIELETRPAKVVYCTEEGRKTFRNFLQRTGLENTGGNLEVLFLGSVNRGIPWQEVVNEIIGHCIMEKADVVIFDTLTRWARILPDQENDAGAAAMVMEPLELLRKANIAVLAVFHDRKSGGDVSDSSRGSSAFGGAADILLNLTNPNTNGHPNRRLLSMVGRFDDPADWTVEWDRDNQVYTLLDGEGKQDIERKQTKGYIRIYLNNGPLTGTELAAAMSMDPRFGTFRRALEELLQDGLITRTGTGKRGNPYVYALAPQPAFGATE